LGLLSFVSLSCLNDVLLLLLQIHIVCLEDLLYDFALLLIQWSGHDGGLRQSVG